ncbi:UvrD-helicase domain-containing protein [Clostridiales bacterium FE2010]|nr:UvrD-helicase domain-containing protein [Clostridiales bacterium FE2010]
MDAIQIQLSSTFSDAAAKLEKPIRSKVTSTLDEFYKNPQSKGLNLEKLSGPDLYSARVDDNYRIIFAQPGGTSLILMLYVDTHEKAYKWAETHHVEINPLLGSLDVVKTLTPKFSQDPVTKKLCSKLGRLSDEQLLKMGIPEEYWEQFKTKVYNKGQLTGYKSLISEAAYHTLEFILEGESIEDAMMVFEMESEEIVPAEVVEKKPFFADYDDQDLVKVGVPVDSVALVKLIKTEKELELYASELPLLASQSLYALYNGSTIEEVQKTSFDSAEEINEDDYIKALENPITLAEFAPVESEKALKAIMELPTAKWRVFLHPIQRQLAQRNYNGAAQVIGGAGTGKTVVIVHRAKYLAGKCQGDEKILVTSFNKTLTADIKKRLGEICSEEELKHIYVINVDKEAYDLTKKFVHLNIKYGTNIEVIWSKALDETGFSVKYSVDFCMDEFRDVIQEQNITQLSDYLEAQRYGRGKQFDRKSREEFWIIAEKYIELCNQMKTIDIDRAENIVTEIIRNDKMMWYKSVLVDECQDLRAPALRMLRALAGEPHENDLYLSGDSRQRIYNSRTSLSQCGININNRSRNLKLNYRTTAEIYEFAFKLQEKHNYDDMNGKSIDKIKNDCVFRGSKPYIRKYDSEQKELEELIRDIREKIKHGMREQDICVMLRHRKDATRYANMLQNNGLSVLLCSNEQEDDENLPGVRVMTMHRSKGMEYTNIYLPSLTDEAIPSSKDMAKAKVEGNEQEMIVKESNILSVAITRAKRFAWLSYYGRPSTLLEAWETK